jgi:hypothetical protein
MQAGLNHLADEAANLLKNKRWKVAKDLNRQLAALVQSLIEFLDTQMEQNGGIDRVVEFWIDKGLSHPT